MIVATEPKLNNERLKIILSIDGKSIKSCRLTSINTLPLHVEVFIEGGYETAAPNYQESWKRVLQRQGGNQGRET